jgi:pyruvate formate lyase activating enzyme
MALDQIGLIKTTLIDYPGEVAATMFTPGCNLRCPYCHNPDFVEPPFPEDLVSLRSVEAFLEKRHSVLGGVCISGGEPLMHPDLPELIEKIHAYGLHVKIDTNGTFPHVLASLNVDYIAMDVKTSPGNYNALGFNGDPAVIQESIEYIKASGIPHEFRTTVVPGLVQKEDIEALLPLLEGAQQYVLTPFRGGKTLDPDWQEVLPYPAEFMHSLAVLATEEGIPTRVRNLD